MGFYGKLSAERMLDDSPDLFGFLVGLPGLTRNAHEKAKKLMGSDKHFLFLSSNEISSLLHEQKLLKQPPVGQYYSDVAVIVSKYGLFSAAKELDPATRLPTSVRVWGVEQVPDPVIHLIANDGYSDSLPILKEEGVLAQTAEKPQVHDLTIVEVVGSNNDFEYQLPASPKFFVGRRNLLKDFQSIIGESENRGTVLVVNGQSGWGKSSLALQFKKEVMSTGGLGIVVDTRTASSTGFVSQVIRRCLLDAESKGMLSLPANAAFGSLSSSIATIKQAKWNSSNPILLLFFDQFENIFKDSNLTKEFRDFALAVRELQVPIVVGYAWKTDMVGWVEGYPYQFRDEIRANATVLLMQPFGPNEISTLIKRLEKLLASKLSRELRERLREVSQGLPWLFKKLADHIRKELEAGKNQEDLIAEALNVKRLFENDLAELGPQERESLSKVARLSPLSASDATDLIPNEIIQSLINRRLIVVVGSYLDTYWDIFRDFLNTGDISIPETYILRQTPSSVSRLVKAVIAAGGDLPLASALNLLHTSEGVIFNLSRELRLMGVFKSVARHICVADEIMKSKQVEESIRDRVSLALRRHKIFSVLIKELSRNDGRITIDQFTEVLPQVFPAVRVGVRAWRTYTLCFIHWFRYAKLVKIENHCICLGPGKSAQIDLLGKAGSQRVFVRPRQIAAKKRVFPQALPSQALLVVKYLLGKMEKQDIPKKYYENGMCDLVTLGLVNFNENGEIMAIEENILNPSGNFDQLVLATHLKVVPGGEAACRALKGSGPKSALDVGMILKAEHGVTWTDLTTKLRGRCFKSWCIAAGVIPRAAR